MLSLRSCVLAATAALVAVVNADYIIDPSTVPLSTRRAWCQSEKAQCPLICSQIASGGTRDNSCDPDTLTYGCICANGAAPNVSEYTLTLPYHTCTEWGQQCVKQCGSNSACASSCLQDHPCGAKNPYKPNTTSTTTTSSPTSSATGTIFSNVPGQSSAGGLAPPLGIARVYGTAVVMGTLFAGFALLL